MENRVTTLSVTEITTQIPRDEDNLQVASLGSSEDGRDVTANCALPSTQGYGAHSGYVQ